MFFQNRNSSIPDPKKVEIPNPIIEVETVEEMEQYLDFEVPVLDKEVKSYSVYVEDEYPTMGQIDYADGSELRIKYGTGDISGVYGSTVEQTKKINDVDVDFYKNDQTQYAVWDQNSFTFSYIYNKNADADIESLIWQFK